MHQKRTVGRTHGRTTPKQYAPFEVWGIINGMEPYFWFRMQLPSQIKSTAALNIWAATWQNQQSDCAPSEDSDQPGHPPSLIRVFAVRMKKAWFLSYPLSAQRRLWSDWAGVKADQSLRWEHSHFVAFVMSRLIWIAWYLMHNVSRCAILFFFSFGLRCPKP